MSKIDRYWEHTSAADDGDDEGYEVVRQDSKGNWIDDFNFNDYKADRGLSSTDSIWKRYGYSGSSIESARTAWRGQGLTRGLGVDFTTAKKIEAAQRLVQGFVDTFSLDTPLHARFSADQKAAGGKDGAKDVVISHRPLLDQTLDESSAHGVMTAQAANAAARARFGGEETKSRHYAVASRISAGVIDFDDVAVAVELRDILDGYRIDSAFRRDYPGYEDVYAPAQAYIARGLLGDRATFDLEDFAGASIANAALNYAPFTDWNGREGEREWWTTWADEYAHDSIANFADGVVEGVKHLQQTLPPRPDKPVEDPPKPPKKGGDQPGKGGDKGDQPGGDDGGTPGGSGGKGDQPSDDEGKTKSDTPSDQPGSDEEPGTDSPAGGGDEPGDDDNPDGGDGGEQGGDEPQGNVKLPTGLGDGVSMTGLANGQTKDLDEDGAERLAAMASALAVARDDKEVGEVYWNANGIRGGRIDRIHIKPEPSANGYIRRAFTRSKTSHYNTERGHKSGRIDNRSLTRIASDDYRLFSKRTAPSDTKYRVWLLIDNSGSMSGSPSRDAANLAASVALAVRHIPNVTLDVWAWTSGIRVAGAQFSAIRIYADGEPIDKIADVSILPQGGTPDNLVLSWAAREIRKQCRPDETPVLLMASDGSGGLATEAFYRDPNQRKNWERTMTPEEIDKFIGDKVGKDRVAAARKSGVKVLSVAIGDLDIENQDRIYGEGNHLPWRGSIKKMAKPLGDLLAKVASNRIK